MKNLFLIPARDVKGNALRVPDPVTGEPLPAVGAWKAATQFWLRRVAAGDVTEGQPPAAVESAVEPPQVVVKASKPKA